MSFIPDLGQVQKNKTILQELEEKKRRMRSGIIFLFYKMNSVLILIDRKFNY